MKFSCKLNKAGVGLLLAAAQGLLRMNTTCVMILSDVDGLELKLFDLKAQVFFKLAHGRFADFRIQSRANNKIALEINLTTFVESLKSCMSSYSTEFKLTKKRGMPMFSVMPSELASGLQIKQDVPIIKILTKLNEYDEPRNPKQKHVTIMFPDLRVIKTVLDRMKGFTKYLDLKASSEGVLTLSVDGENVKVSVRFENLKQVMDEDEDEDEDEVNNEEAAEQEEDNGAKKKKKRRRGETEIKVSLSIKELSAFCAAAATKPSRILLAVFVGYAAIFYLQMDDEVSSMTYYIPVVVDPDSHDDDVNEGEANEEGNNNVEDNEQNM